jgi:ABC-2 type transport system permease protein
MSSVGLLLGKDLRRLVRSPVLLAALVLYPLLVALLVGLVVRYAGERPRVALVDEAGLPRSILLGNQRFDLERLFSQASEADLVRMSPERASHELGTGRVLAVLTIPEDFSLRLRGLHASPRLVLRTGSGTLGASVTEKMRALVYAINLKLQQAYIEANLGYVRLLRRGGSGTIGRSKLTVIGLDRAERELRAMQRSTDPSVSRPAGELADFVNQVNGAVGQVGEFLRATANPVQLVTTARPGRAWVLSAQVQAYAYALALAFVAVILGAATITAERDERTLGRLVQGLVGLGELVVEKIVLVALVGTAITLALAIGFGVVVEIGGVSGGQPWDRVPLLIPGFALASAAFGALGVLVGALARDAGAAMLLALLVGLPVVLAGVIPAGAFALADWLRAIVPFGHAVDLATSALFDPSPWGTVLRQSLWLLLIAVVLAVLARIAARRLLA